ARFGESNVLQPSGARRSSAEESRASDATGPGPSAVDFPRRRRTGRSLLVALASVAVVLAMAVWSSRPSYSWASMVRALDSQSWIESRGDAESGPPVRNWFSRVNRVVIYQSTDQLVWDDLAEGVRSRFRAGGDVLEQSRISPQETPSVEQSLISLLLRQGERWSGQEQNLPSGPAEVVRQSWRDMSDVGGWGVELEVDLAWSDAAEDQLHLVLLLDPETHLPLQCRVLDASREDANVIHFEYPATGPREVYDLGVPATVAVLPVDAVPQLPLAASSESAVVSIPPSLPSLPPAVTTETLETLVVESESAEARTAAVIPQETRIDSRDVQEAAPPPIAPVTLSPGEMTQRVDDLMSELWERNGIVPATDCEDLEFLRRVYLDLTGRVPTVSEVREFINEVPAGRRERLVEQLLARRDHATHLAAVWRRFLLPAGVDLTQYGGTASFEQWLTDRFRSNTPYDQTVRELLLAEGRVSESGPILFYTALKLEPEALAAQTSRAFLGMRLECAQCHDHFFDKRWKQTDFWAYAAFFARISRPQGKMSAVSPVLQVKDSTWGDVTLPDEEEIVPPRYPLGAPLTEDAAAASRRRELADWMTSPQNPHFARATVNRVWAHLFGRGIVDPVDDMRSDHPAVCPEVLDELAGFFIASGFDLRELFRVIVLSQTYQRSSSAPDDDPSRALLFAQMNMKSFTAEQLYDSIAVATRLEAPALEDGSLLRATNSTRKTFLEQFRTPPGQVTDYQAGIPQALSLMNGQLIQNATGMTSSGILRSLEAPFFSDEQRVETLFLATLSRPPDDAERQTMLNYVTTSEGARAERLGDILWALLNSAEFTLNH
ncbi:MAG: DUF1553 domain-containing protein, partial [Planctomycetaceae bacterium]|nr:DUF1553 domain-containing protein [Planctomycetaceae bacterium]